MNEQAITSNTALVVYASTHGHTAKIATRLADALRAEDLDVELRAVADAGAATAADYSLVVIAGSVHREHHQKELVAWVSQRRESLEQRPTLFLSVSLSAADDSAESQAATRRFADEFCKQTGWTPTRTERLAGALQYREYDVFTRGLMRLLMKKMGHPTDSSHDYDYTDWDGVDRLGRELAGMVATAGRAA